ncbi:hypothetical protein AB0H34_21910 [Saccharopolyspora shandongensis]|uniref:hypothetical protein n=1 Tax=Saccharopolyspora shandongensis TaxID=418495 RepID=UPI0033C6D4D9
MNYAKHSLQDWLRNIDMYVEQGESVIEAASLAVRDADDRMRERNHRNTEVRPHDL